MTPLECDLALADMLSTARLGVQPRNTLVDCDEAVLADVLEDSPCSETEPQVPLPAFELRGESGDGVETEPRVPLPASELRGESGHGVHQPVLVSKGGRPKKPTRCLGFFKAGGSVSQP